MRYYFRVEIGGEAYVLVIAPDQSWSMHSSLDESIADGDGSVCPFEFVDQAWAETTYDHANSLLRFEL